MNLENKQFDFCLLIACYNNIEGLILSVKSVHYYFNHFIIVIVDDGSEVPVSIDYVKSKTQVDYKIIVLRNNINRGITDALNLGLRWIRENTDSKFIARLDCGDICKKNRFYKQIEYLKKHPDTGLLGSWCVFENKKNLKKYYYKTPIGNKSILREMYFKNVFIHPTVIFRASLLEKVGYYPHDFQHAEDYAFFWQLIKISPFYILNEYLVVCEVNEQGISFKNRQEQLFSRIRVVAKYGTNPFLKIAGMLRIYTLSLLPERLVLPLKNSVNRQ